MQELINADYGVKTHVTEKEKISNYKPRPKKYFLNIKMVYGTGTRFIYVLQADGTVSYVPVKTGRHMGSEYEITEGLSDGQTVVVKGQAALKDGVKVNVL